jgi:ATP-binding cassette, subfamily C, bacterial LapB
MESGDNTKALHRIWLRSDVMAASLGINVLGLALPLAILQVYDRVIRHHAISTLIVLTVGVLCAFALEFVLRVLRARIMSAEGARYDHRENCRTLERFLGADVEAFKKETPGTHADRFHAIQTVRTFYCQASALLADAPFMLLFIALIGVIAGWMAIVPLVLLGVFVALGAVVSRRLMIETGRREQSDVKRQNFLVESVAGIATIKALGLESLMERRHERLQEDAAAAFGAIARVTAQTQSVASELAQAASVLTVAIGAVAVVGGSLTIGGLAATTILTGRLLQPVLKGLALWARYPFIRIAEDRLSRMHDLPQQTAGHLPFPRQMNGALRFERVSFRYDGAPRNAVDELTLDVPPRTYVGITGPTGSGRTTLLKLANGLLTPTSGSVRFGGVPVCLHAPRELRRQIALMATSPTIYAGTLLENLTLFENGAVKRRALALCRVLGLEDYVAGLSHGLDTPLHSADTPIGIAQRISIVRALAQNPSIVLFDMANAALDHEADRMLLAYFAKQKGRRAAVFVTDRPSYLRMCDVVYEIADGKLRRRIGAPLQTPANKAAG